MDKDALDFHRDLIRRFGDAVQLRGILGVCQCLPCVTSAHAPLQARELYIADPLALHHIFVKDIQSFDQSPVVIAYVIGLLASNFVT